MLEEEEDISADELRDRVIYALFLPTVRLARLFGVGLAEMKGWLEIAYFHELRREDMKGREAAELLDVSMSKVALLSRQLKENFLRPEHEAELSRRIEFALWAEPLSKAKLAQVFPGVERRQVDAALRELLDDGRVRKVKRGTVTCFELVIQTDRRVWDTWVARVDGLQDALGNVTNVVYGRFFRGEKRALARTLSFRIRNEDLGELVKMYEQAIFARIVELDARAQDVSVEDTEEMSISTFWGPYHYIRRVLAGEFSEERRDE